MPLGSMILYMAAGENCNFSGNADTEMGDRVVVFNAGGRRVDTLGSK